LPRRDQGRDELERLKLEGLKWTVRHAYENVRFYREAMRERGITPDDIKTLDDLMKLPFTDKETLRAAYPFGLLAVPKSELVEIHVTSGTTGTLTVGLYSMNDVEVWAEVMARSLYMSGLREEDVFQITPSFGLFTGGFGFYYGARKIGAFIVPTGAGNSRRQMQLMRGTSGRR
jgi:phenylacetate-CoA ligase